MNLNVILAIFRRNFVSYFSNPTGYVFICVFVLASSFAAFWPADFFNANLANLDQLNKYLPIILIFFIPAITMGIWADERRQGTDELLLTIPATDLDVVLGKFLAAVAIYTVSLLFSMISNFLVLRTLGIPDFGLICGTYFGYWIVGIALLAIGMAASFLTGNLTVAFILGAVLISPVVFANYGDLISLPSWLEWVATRVLHIEPHQIGMAIKRWSIAEQFRDFSRGVISISSIVYFLGIVVLMLYLSMVLIGRRHWKGGAEGQGSRVHYTVRFLALGAAILGLNMFMARNDRLRVDVTSEQLSSLSSQTRQILKTLDTKYPVLIDAYISPSVPESYTQTRLNLISTLREFEATSNGKIQVTIHETEPLTEEAQRAETKYGIKAQTVMTTQRGARRPEDIFLGVAFNCGVENVVVPFIDRGIPVEYELIRSISTVASPKRLKMGILITDAKLYGGFDMQSMSTTQDEQIINELRKQYELVQVDPSQPITEKYDVLLAVQPSSLSPPQMENFVACVKSGQPTAIFEDPFPYFFRNVPGTDAEKQPQGGSMFAPPPPAGPKGDISRLWRLLGVDFNGSQVIWQDYNPYSKIDFPKEFVFIDEGAGSFDQTAPVSSDLRQLLFCYPGSVRGHNASTLKFTPVVTTSDATGEVPADQILQRGMMGQVSLNPNLARLQKETNEKYVLAAQIKGKLKPEVMPMSDKKPEAGEAELGTADENAAAPKGAATTGAGKAEAGEAEAGEAEAGKPASAADEKPAEPGINVVLVADMDCLYSDFFLVRSQGENEDAYVNFDFDNVTFVLNVLDVLSGDERFVEIRKRRFKHRTLSRLTDATATAREQADDARAKFEADFEAARNEAQKKFDDEIDRLEKQTNLNELERSTRIAMARQEGGRRLQTRVAQLEKDRDRAVKDIERNLALQVRQVQDSYKTWAVLLPPIPPLLVGLFVFFNRRAREREGVSKTRLR